MTEPLSVCGEGWPFQAVGGGEAGDGVAAIGGLNEGGAPVIFISADSLTEGGVVSVARILRWQRSGDKKR